MPKKNSINKWANGVNRQFSKHEVQMTMEHMEKMFSILSHQETQINILWLLKSQNSQYGRSNDSTRADGSAGKRVPHTLLVRIWDSAWKFLKEPK